jgi:hypothetical protein
MKPIDGYFLIKPDDLFWRPSNLMKIPNADFLERTRSEILGARLWRLPPGSANTLHRHPKMERCSGSSSALRRKNWRLGKRSMRSCYIQPTRPSCQMRWRESPGRRRVDRLQSRGSVLLALEPRFCVVPGSHGVQLSGLFFVRRKHLLVLFILVLVVLRFG